MLSRALRQRSAFREDATVNAQRQAAPQVLGKQLTSKSRKISSVPNSFKEGWITGRIDVLIAEPVVVDDFLPADDVW